MLLPLSIPTNPSCPNTDWSIVRAAAYPIDAAGRAALENLCRRYWYPIYAFIRRQGIRRQGTPEARAQDLTQAFFVHVLKKKVLAAADPQKGSFRGFLLTACRNFVINQGKSDEHEPLNGPVVSLDALQDAARRFDMEPPAPDPEAGFDLDWAFAVLTNALDAVRSRYAARGESDRFDSLRIYLPLLDGEPPGPQSEAADKLGITDGAYKKALYDLRAVFAQQVRHEVAQTLSDPAAVEEEIGNLLANVRHVPSARNSQPDQEANSC